MNAPADTVPAVRHDIVPIRFGLPPAREPDAATMGFKAYNLDQVLDGDLGPVLASCVDADLVARLEALEQ